MALVFFAASTRVLHCVMRCSQGRQVCLILLKLFPHQFAEGTESRNRLPSYLHSSKRNLLSGTWNITLLSAQKWVPNTWDRVSPQSLLSPPPLPPSSPSWKAGTIMRHHLLRFLLWLQVPLSKWHSEREELWFLPFQKPFPHCPLKCMYYTLNVHLCHVCNQCFIFLYRSIGAL